MTKRGLVALALAAPGSAEAADGSASFQVDAGHTGQVAASSPAPPLTKAWSRELGTAVSYPLVA